MKTEAMTVRDLFEVACEDEENPTLVAGQVYAEIARAQFSDEAVKDCRVMAEAAIRATEGYSDALSRVMMILIGLSDIADEAEGEEGAS